MVVITVASRKGGSGKSTLTAHLAAYANKASRRCLLIDADPQGSLALWHGLRKSGEPLLRSATRGVDNLIKAAKDAGLEWVFIDTPPLQFIADKISLEFCMGVALAIFRRKVESVGRRWGGLLVGAGVAWLALWAAGLGPDVAGYDRIMTDDRVFSRVLIIGAPACLIVAGAIAVPLGLGEIALITAISASLVVILGAFATPFLMATSLAIFGDLTVRKEGTDLAAKLSSPATP